MLLTNFFDVEYLLSLVRRMRSFVFGIGRHWNCIAFCEDTKDQSMLLDFRLVVWYVVELLRQYYFPDHFP